MHKVFLLIDFSISDEDGSLDMDEVKTGNCSWADFKSKVNKYNLTCIKEIKYH